MSTYRESDVPDQAGKTFIVTGANTGIGYDAARVLAERGARVLLGCRSEEKAEQALANIREVKVDVDISWLPLDLASLASIKSAAERANQETRIDGLINNAGVMIPPRTLTEDGFELQFGVNHLGHFALTGLLMEKIKSNPGARIVNVSSLAHGNGRIIYDDLHAEKVYNRMERYAMSKFANILFTYELQRRLAAASSVAIAVACHPGGSATELGRYFPAIATIVLLPLRFLFNTSAEGALPTLMAATSDDVKGGDYFGPTQLGELRHSATKVDTVSAAKDEANAARLWQISLEQTGVEYSI